MQEQTTARDEEEVLEKLTTSTCGDLLKAIESCTSPEELKRLLYSLDKQLQGKK